MDQREASPRPQVNLAFQEIDYYYTWPPDTQQAEIKQPDQIPLQYIPPKIQTHKFLRSLDLFSFIPVPTAQPLSSRISILGTAIMFTLFLLYIILDLTAFIISNPPTVNQYTNNMDFQNITLPKIAFAFFDGDPFTSTINDVTILTFSMDQINKQESSSISDTQTPIQLISCRPDWISDQKFPLLCPQNDTFMLGALYRSKQYRYPRINIKLCTPGPNLICINDQLMAKTCAGGRVLLYLQDNGPNLDLSTGKKCSHYFQFLFYIQGQFYMKLNKIRALISFQKSSFNIQPDYLLRWKTQLQQFIYFQDLVITQTNVSIFNTALTYQIQFQVDQDEVMINVVYSTLLDQISKWGAFWSVLYFIVLISIGIFSLYFLRFNSTQFYELNQNWRDFDQEIGIRRENFDGGDVKIPDNQQLY